MLLAANAFAAEEESDAQDEASEEPNPDIAEAVQGGGQQAAAWARVRAERERILRELPPEVFYLWPEHVPALHLFRDVETQFRLVDGLPTGLDYVSVRAHPAYRAIPRHQREAVLADVCTMEGAWVRERFRLRQERLSQDKQFGDQHG